MNRIDERFLELRLKGKKAFIPFITCGDPSIEETKNIVLELEKSGADIIELGVPFSDPLADGPIIQDSYCRALKNGFKVKDIFKCGREIRKSSSIPLVIMIYYNLVYTIGVEKFLKEASESGFDGLIIPDIPLEERGGLKELCEKSGIYLIPLVAPTSNERIAKIVNGAKGFVYCVSSNGTTGERSRLRDDIVDYLHRVRGNANAPICLGFGISSVDVVREIRKFCDGVIVGSAIVRRINSSKEDAINLAKDIKSELED